MKKVIIPSLCLLLVATSCKKNNDSNSTPVATAKDINTAARATIDRFSSTAGHLMVRNGTNGLPAANSAINFDVAPFFTMGLDRTGAQVLYYNFDVQTTLPSPIYVLFKSGVSTPLSGQNNIVATIPGDVGYNDFWLMKKVTVPESYVPNSLTSESEILSSGYSITTTTNIVNCPIVPYGSTAARSKTGGAASALSFGWYKGLAVAYFNFDEAAIITSGSSVPLSDIYVMFANNASPDDGFKVEPGTSQTHNVLATLPGDATYSPLWDVNVVDTSNFSAMTNLATASSFSSMVAGATVNCPIVK